MSTPLPSQNESAGRDQLQEFQGWAFSDLCDDDVKGIFAEWMVRQLLHCPSPRRVSWADNDIILPSGISIEVKSSAIWQSWKLRKQDGARIYPLPASKPFDPKKIRFCGLKARLGDAKPVGEPVFKSHLYVFCFQSQKDPTKWDALDLDQWEFYIMSQHDLIDLKVGGSISLDALRKFRLCHPCSMMAPNGSLTAAQFQSLMQFYTGRVKESVNVGAKP